MINNKAINSIIAISNSGCTIGNDFSKSRYIYENIEICGADFMAIVIDGILKIFYDNYCTPKEVSCGWIQNEKPCEEGTIFSLNKDSFSEHIGGSGKSNLTIFSEGISALLKNFRDCAKHFTNLISTTPASIDAFDQSHFNYTKDKEIINSKNYSIATNDTSNNSYNHGGVGNQSIRDSESILVIVLASVALVTLLGICVGGITFNFCFKKKSTEVDQAQVIYSPASTEENDNNTQSEAQSDMLRYNDTSKEVGSVPVITKVSFFEVKGNSSSEDINTSSSELSVAGLV